VKPIRISRLAVPLAVGALLLSACGGDNNTDDDAASTGGNGGSQEVSGSVKVDGSSTVAPLTTAAAEFFKEEQPGVNVTVGTSGTGGGFEKFCAGETDISDASRPIDDADEVPICEEAGVEYGEIPVANDALTVVVSAENDWVDCLTTEQLKAIWEPGSKVSSWKDVDSSFPDEKLELFGPGTDSGTFDFFTGEINGEEGQSRADYQATEDDNVTVQGVEGTKGGLGYFGLSYYEQNQDKLGVVQVNGGGGCVDPSTDTVQDGSYKPLSRPLFIYVKAAAIKRPEVKGFVEYYAEQADKLAEQALFVPLTPEQKAELKPKLDKLHAGA
jgi:phosphate transport system substrate-binding protein